MVAQATDLARRACEAWDRLYRAKRVEEPLDFKEGLAVSTELWEDTWRLAIEVAAQAAKESDEYVNLRNQLVALHEVRHEPGSDAWRTAYDLLKITCSDVLGRATPGVDTPSE